MATDKGIRPPYQPHPFEAGYEPTLNDIARWVERELGEIAKVFADMEALELRPTHREPARPREGMIVHADGTSWDPGSGAGAYEYRGGIWRKL